MEMRHLCVFILLLIVSLAGSVNMGTAGENERTNEEIVRHCEKLMEPGNFKVNEYLKFVEELGKKRDFRGLKAIYSQRFPFSSYAARITTRYLDEKSAVQFCTGFELNSSNWREAVYALKYHQRKIAIGYIKQIATSALPEVRGWCYEVCCSAGWDDLISFAQKDSTNEAIVEWQNSSLIDKPTLGHIAQKYVQKMKTLKKRD